MERGLGVTTKYHRTVLKIHYLSSNLPMAALPFQDISLGVILRHLSTCHLAPVLSPCLSNFPLHSSTHPCQWPLGPLLSGGDVSQREAHSPAVPKSPPTLTSEIPPGPSLTIPPFCPRMSFSQWSPALPPAPLCFLQSIPCPHTLIDLFLGSLSVLTWAWLQGARVLPGAAQHVSVV